MAVRNHPRTDWCWHCTFPKEWPSPRARHPPQPSHPCSPPRISPPDPPPPRPPPDPSVPNTRVPARLPMAPLRTANPLINLRVSSARPLALCFGGDPWAGGPLHVPRRLVHGSGEAGANLWGGQGAARGTPAHHFGGSIEASVTMEQMISAGVPAPQSAS